MDTLAPTPIPEKSLAEDWYNALIWLWINPSQISVAWLTLAVPWAAMAILSEKNLSEKLTGLWLFILGRLFDILDGKYARFLMKQNRWSSEWDGATLDSHCDKAGIYIPLILFLYLHGGDNAQMICMSLIVLVMGWLDIKSTFMRTTDWLKIGESLQGGQYLLRQDQDAPIVPNNPANTANGWWKIKATAQTVWVWCALLYDILPEGLSTTAIALFVSATVCSLVSLAKKTQLKKAQAIPQT